MSRNNIFTKEEKAEILNLLTSLRNSLDGLITREDELRIFNYIYNAYKEKRIQRDIFGTNPVLSSFHTAKIAFEELSLKRDGIIAIMLYSVTDDTTSAEMITEDFGTGVPRIIRGLTKIRDLYKKNPVVESENFRNLLLSFAEDMRVIIIMLSARLWRL